jgi:hypothetical protein
LFVSTFNTSNVLLNSQSINILCLHICCMISFTQVFIHRYLFMNVNAKSQDWIFSPKFEIPFLWDILIWLIAQASQTHVHNWVFLVCCSSMSNFQPVLPTFWSSPYPDNLPGQILSLTIVVIVTPSLFSLNMPHEMCKCHATVYSHM